MKQESEVFAVLYAAVVTASISATEERDVILPNVRNVTEQINVVMVTRILSLGSKYYYQASMCMAL